MSFLSLKKVLVGCLEDTLFSKCEDNPIHFMLSSYKTGAQKRFFRKITLKHPIHWRNIPIEKKRTAGPILYTSALPHIVAREAFAFEQATLAEISEQLVTQLNQSRLQTLNSDLDHDDDLLFFVHQLWAEFKIETCRPGWLALHLSNRGIDLWIQHHQKVFQTNHKHTQLFLHYGCLSQMSYSLFKSVNHTDRDHNNPAFKPSNQHRHQNTFTDNLMALLQPTSSKNNASKQEFPGPEPSNHVLSAQRAKLQLIPPEPTSHRHVAGQSSPTQQALRPKQKQLAENWLWQVQYTHARCCSVIQRWESIKAEAPKGTSLKKAAATEVFTTQPLKRAVSIDTSPTGPSQPRPIPRPVCSAWPKRSENHEHQASGTQMQHEHQAQQLIAQQLIASLIEVTDNLFWIPYRWPSQQYFLLLKGSSGLCKAFEAFSSHCLVGFGHVAQQAEQVDDLKPMVGEIAAHQAHFQIRFDLVIATRNILKVLLEVHLAAPAPTEL